MKKLILSILPAIALCLVYTGCSKENGSGGSGDGTPSSRAGEAVRLELKWPVGQRYVQRMEVNQSNETKLPQRPEPIKQQVDMVQEYAMSVIKDREPAGKVLELEYLATQMDIMMGGRPVLSFDSAGEALVDENNPMVSTFRKLIGLKLTFYMDGENQVEKVEGMEEFMESMAKDSPAQARGVLSSMFNEDSFKQMVDFNKGLPVREVKPGDTWAITNQIAMGPLGTMEVKLNYKFDDWEMHDNRDCVRLAFTGTMSTKETTGKGPLGMNMTVDQGDLNGNTWFDPELGMMVDSQIKQKIQLTVQRKFPQPNNPEGAMQNITTMLDQNISLKMVEVSKIATTE